MDDVALLRMLAVAPERRGEGLGYLLVETATERARADGRAAASTWSPTARRATSARSSASRPSTARTSTRKIAATAEYLLARTKDATWMRKEL